MSKPRRALVLGGTGFFGSRLVGDLVAHTDLDITTVSRRRRGLDIASSRVSHVVADIRAPVVVREVMDGHQLVLHAAGPFEKMPIEPLDAAIDLGIDYVDISENRLFRNRLIERSERITGARTRVMNGFSVVPGMSALFARFLAPQFQDLLSVRTFAAPDTRRHRGRAMFRTMLYGAGRRFSTLRRGELQDAFGWSQPEWVEFPEPVGRVLTYLVYGMADLDVLPDCFGVGTVEFRAGCEHSLLNRLLSAAATIRQRTSIPLEGLTEPVRGIAWLAGRVGRRGGAAMFEFSGRRDGREATDRIAVLSGSEGEEIPVALAGMAAELWMRNELPGPGIIDLSNWIEPDRLIAGLRARALEVLRETNGVREWIPYHSARR